MLDLTPPRHFAQHIFEAPHPAVRERKRVKVRGRVKLCEVQLETLAVEVDDGERELARAVYGVGG